MTEADDSRLIALKDLLKEAARAHHVATGGTNVQWARWYAEYLDGKLAELLGDEPAVDTVAAWLTMDDAEYRRQDRSVGWPRFYAARWLERTGL